MRKKMMSALLCSVTLGATAQAEQVLETKKHATPAACQLQAAVAAGDLRKRGFAVYTIMQTQTAVVYKVAHGTNTAFVTCDGPNFKSWLM